jgi:hypothetical protein
MIEASAMVTLGALHHYLQFFLAVSVVAQRFPVGTLAAAVKVSSFSSIVSAVVGTIAVAK